jgi:hypothetical protein
MTDTGYIFFAAIAMLIVWLVAELSGAGALRGPRSMQREAGNQVKKISSGNTA